MSRGKRMRPGRDKKVFARTANKIHKLNLPGYQNRRGGTCL